MSNLMRFLSKIDYLLRETWLGLKRGGWMNWAAISTVAVLLFLLGISLQFSWQLDGVLGQLGNQLEISVYLDDNVSGAEIQNRVRLMEGVSNVELISKEEAWPILLKELGRGDLHVATQQLGGNPLVDELKVKTVNTAQVASVAKRISGLKGINEVWYTSEVVERISQLRQAVSNGSMIAVSILTLVAIAVIVTTIRFIVIARRREIEVMQLVGATQAWIYFPFILQGVCFGLLGAGLAYGSISIMVQLFSGVILNQPELIKSLSVGLVTDLRAQLLLPVILGLFGTTVGVLGSLLAVRRISA